MGASPPGDWVGGVRSDISGRFLDTLVGGSSPALNYELKDQPNKGSLKDKYMIPWGTWEVFRPEELLEKISW